MKDIERIADDLYIIKQIMPSGNLVGVVASIGEERIGLIDSGLENTPKEHIFPLVEELKQSKNQIDLLVNTHRDGDHILGNKAIRENTNAKVAAHKFEVEAIQNIDIALKDGDVLNIGDRKMMVIHTPGHTPGSICLYDTKSLILITGDSVCGERKDLIRMGKAVYITSLKHLLSLKIKMMVMSHPFQPLGKFLLLRDEPQRMINASIHIAEKLL